jgi:hypothetical protein
LDNSGDGVPELILFSGLPGASPELLVYDLKDGTLNWIGERGWEIGFELTILQTVSDLHGEE